jgi:hypothetical protein
VQALLGLLILAFVLSIWLDAPEWLSGTISVVFIGIFGFSALAALIFYVRHRLAVLRRVRFRDASLDQRVKRLPSKRRLRRRDSGAWRPGAVRTWLAYRGLQVLVVALFPATFAVAVAGLSVESKWRSIAMVIGAPILGLALLFPLLKASQRRRRQWRRVRAPDAANVLATDPRPPIVLLRAFRADGADANAALPADVPISFEEFLVEPLRHYGPVVAIGRPGETLPPLGAYREYVADDWQGRVSELLKTSGIIVAILDDTAGLRWELEQIDTLGLRQRLLLVLPSNDSPALPALETAQTPLAKREDVSAQSEQSLAMVFDKDGHPSLIVGPHRHAEYYRDAVRLGGRFIQASDTSPPSSENNIPRDRGTHHVT